MTERVAINDVVVLLPGITGSVLKKNGKDVWAPSFGGIMGVLRRGADAIRELALDGDDPTREDLGDGVTADQLWPDVHLIPGLWKIDGYTKISQTLSRNLQLEPGSNYFEFPYDWRRTNVAAANKLARQAEEWLHAWQQRPGRQDARLIFLAHSMGGLVARHYLEQMDGWRKTRALITFGTPYRGAVKALGFLANGYFQEIGPLRPDFSDLMRTFTSTYELLPIYECCDVGNGRLERVAEAAAIPHVDKKRAADALAFHRAIEASVEEHRKIPAYVNDGYKIMPVVSNTQPTLQSGKLVGDRVELYTQRLGNDEGGDGTVPFVSSIPIELTVGNSMYADERHGSLQNADAVLRHIEGAVRAARIPTGSVRATPGVPVALDIEDAYAATDAIQIRGLPDQSVAWLTATVVDTQTNRKDQPIAFQRPAAPGDWWSAQLGPLPAAVYRVTVNGPAGVTPVTDVFAVFD